MQILFDNKLSKKPLVSIILLDWSCRESFHSLYYLNEQTALRDNYEIIWIEYYSRHSPEIEEKLREYERLGKPPVVDKWIVMEMPENVYYHKHLMYNTGIVASQGRIVTVMDSDAVVMPTFVEAIIKSFEKDSNIVLHMDQVRNMNKRFYPFNYPAIDEIIAEGGVNMLNGRPRGLVERFDPLHNVNYGSCMSAMRDDLITIGGADEHIDYLGHICGPYDMTFRLMNAGKKEVWHQNEWLYHTWHPGQAGDKNFAGPHDGKHMSTTALETRWTGRILPLVENPAIRMLRLGERENMPDSSFFPHVINKEAINDWTIDESEFGKKEYGFGSKSITLKERYKKNEFSVSLKFPSKFLIKRVLYKMLLRQFYVTLRIILIKDLGYVLTLIRERRGTVNAVPLNYNDEVKVPSKEFSGFFQEIMNSLKKESILSPLLAWHRTLFKIFFGIRSRIRFIQGIAQYNRYIADECWRNLHRLAKNNKGVAVFGASNIAKILLVLTRDVPIKISGIYDDVKRERFSGYEVLPVEALKGYTGSVIISSLFGVEERIGTLKQLGIKEDKIIRLV